MSDLVPEMPENLMESPKVRAALEDFIVEAVDEATDLLGDESATRVEALTAQLEAWAASAGSLSFNSVYSPLNNYTVRIAPYSLRPVRISYEDQIEVHAGSVTLLEL